MIERVLRERRRVLLRCVGVPLGGEGRVALGLERRRGVGVGERAVLLLLLGADVPRVAQQLQPGSHGVAA